MSESTPQLSVEELQRLLDAKAEQDNRRVEDHQHVIYGSPRLLTLTLITYVRTSCYGRFIDAFVLHPDQSLTPLGLDRTEDLCELLGFDECNCCQELFRTDGELILCGENFYCAECLACEQDAAREESADE